jgi:DNA-binding transcriptional ArsR family regulator
VNSEERRRQIASLTAVNGRVTVVELAERFRVTPETIRRDLTVLDDDGAVHRVHGGAVPSNDYQTRETPLDVRSSTSTAAKIRIGRAAAGLLPDSGLVFLDAGTDDGDARRRRSPRTPSRVGPEGSRSSPTACRSPSGSARPASRTGRTARRPDPAEHPGGHRRHDVARPRRPARRSGLHRDQRPVPGTRPVHDGRPGGGGEARHDRQRRRWSWRCATRRSSGGTTW